MTLKSWNGIRNFKLVCSVVFAMSLLVGCSEDDTVLDDVSENSSNSTANAGTDILANLVSDGDVASFSITLDSTPLDETISVDANDDDFIANTTFNRTIYINFSESGTVSVSGDDNGIVAVSGNDVVATNLGSEVIMYVLSGTSNNGFFKLYSSKKQGITLNGLNLTNPDGAAINNQSHKRTFVVLADDSKNVLTDGSSYADETDDEDMKATATTTPSTLNTTSKSTVDSSMPTPPTTTPSTLTETFTSMLA